MSNVEFPTDALPYPHNLEGAASVQSRMLDTNTILDTLGVSYVLPRSVVALRMISIGFTIPFITSERIYDCLLFSVYIDG